MCKSLKSMGSRVRLARLNPALLLSTMALRKLFDQLVPTFPHLKKLL